ncbi:MAG: nucleotidyltransferase family protein [Candidatus Atribacteria bacterium]|nr:nucleotidyltransferase family protein [Candidatus Atribacteria bacterium]
MKSEIAGVILAAGGSKRIGKPKQLLKLENDYLINSVISHSLESNLSYIIVVLGAYFNQVNNRIINSKKIQIIRNRNWHEGQSTSLIAGLQAADERKADAVMFLLGDQPLISTRIINELLNKYEEGRHEVVMLRTGEKKTPPIVFSRICFDKIYDLKGDKGAREIINSLNTGYVENKDLSAIIDIDTLEEFSRYKIAHSHSL